MQNQPGEIIILYFGTIIFWMLIAGAPWVLGRWWERMSFFRDHMLEQWRPALVIAMIYLVSELLRGRGFNLYGAAIFCQAWIGLAIARSIPEFEPLPVVESFSQRRDMAKTFALFLVVGVLAGAFGMIAGGWQWELLKVYFMSRI